MYMFRTLKQTILREDLQEDPIALAIREVCRRLGCVDDWFRLEDDTDLIEACIYERLALQARYRYLLRLARERHAAYTAPVAAQSMRDALCGAETGGRMAEKKEESLA